MRRASRKIRSADTRQFDLFAVPRVLSSDPPSFHPQLPDEGHTSAYEAEVLDMMVSLLTRQWTCHLGSSDRAREPR